MSPFHRRAATALLLVSATAALATAPARAATGWKRKGRVARSLTADIPEQARIPSRLPALARDLRHALEIPPDWTAGAPPAAELTDRLRIRRALAPHEPDESVAGRSDGERAQWHLARGNALFEGGLETAAAAEWLAATDLAPDLPAAWNNLGAAARRAWRLELAQDVFEAVVELDPADGLAHFNLAMVHQMAGRFREADAHYVRALDLDPRLWLPSRNPLVVGNDRAIRALHAHHVATESAGAVHLDRDARRSPAVGQAR